uniref:3-methyl-2-oxobutanoate hydroxymethyltransferase n=1 Tax=Yersinia enterocolitica W22703 TaxID=913028 RepID=F4MUN0_YEREN|nr:unknown protein [Yersinia enterocolitica W22703]
MKATMSHLRQWKLEKRKFATLTAYDASFAQLFAEQGLRFCWWVIRSV